MVPSARAARLAAAQATLTSAPTLHTSPPTPPRLHLVGCYIGCCPNNLGDGLLLEIARKEFARAAISLNVSVTLADTTVGPRLCRERPDFVVLGGGSILRMQHLLRPFRDMHRAGVPSFVFGLGWMREGLWDSGVDVSVLSS